MFYCVNLSVGCMTIFLLSFTAVIRHLLADNDSCVMTTEEYVQLHELPYDVVLDSGQLCVCARTMCFYYLCDSLIKVTFKLMIHCNNTTYNVICCGTD